MASMTGRRSSFSSVLLPVSLEKSDVKVPVLEEAVSSAPPEVDERSVFDRARVMRSSISWSSSSILVW